uniref:hypothetical protein n=1 Tax=Hydrocytium acuminatum TaxID=1745963 RepID=UPI002A822D9C|nr:hypothetical protein UYM18_pgp097 [Hydrocytium acuminatum]WOR09522.1 hypothetical protein [Hydrocytium acuminatum]
MKTFVFLQICFLANWFLNHKGQKIIKSEFVDLYLTPRAIAVWLMDDGNRHRNTVRFNTNCFSKAEVQCLADVLSRKFALDCSLHCKNRNNKTEYLLYIKTYSYPNLRELVFPIIKEVPSMLYKLPEQSLRKFRQCYINCPNNH